MFPLLLSILILASKIECSICSGGTGNGYKWDTHLGTFDLLSNDVPLLFFSGDDDIILPPSQRVAERLKTLRGGGGGLTGASSAVASAEAIQQQRGKVREARKFVLVCSAFLLLLLLLLYRPIHPHYLRLTFAFIPAAGSPLYLPCQVLRGLLLSGQMRLQHNPGQPVAGGLRGTL